ncbi:MAG TPA: hypothetical protein VMJ66_11225 [Geobacteraceae bacterium]|nr:hypothetical protein [Geobacteraceae bacterium]
MKLLRTKVWPWADVWMLKWSAFLFGIVIGAYFPYFFGKYIWLLLVLAIILAIRPSITYFGNGDK